MSSPALPWELISEIIRLCIRGRNVGSGLVLRQVCRIFREEVDAILKVLIFKDDALLDMTPNISNISVALMARLTYELLNVHPDGVLSGLISVAAEAIANTRKRLRRSDGRDSSQDKLIMCNMVARKLSPQFVRAALKHRYSEPGLFLTERFPEYRNLDMAYAQAFAAYTGDLPLLKKISEFFPDFQFVNNLFGLPLHLAAAEGHPHLVQYLLDHGAADGYVPGYWPIPSSTARKNQTPKIQDSSDDIGPVPDRLLLYDISPYRCAASLAASRGHIEVLKKLVVKISERKGKFLPTFHQSWSSSLAHAIRRRQKEAVSFLLSIAASPSNFSHAFSEATYRKDIKMLDYIYDQAYILKASYDLSGHFSMAVREGSTTVAGWFINHGLHLKSPSRFQHLLAPAVRNGDLLSLQTLIVSGCKAGGLFPDPRFKIFNDSGIFGLDRSHTREVPKVTLLEIARSMDHHHIIAFLEEAELTTLPSTRKAKKARLK